MGAVATALLISLAMTGAMAGAGTDIIDHATVTATKNGNVWHVTPTPEGRELGSSAWSYDPTGEMELHGIPATDTMVNQLRCHALFVPDKTEWQLEEARPTRTMSGEMSSGCNP
ncbi:DUF2599 domain-containing protein [Corynebacterium guangdongense]|uniref:DUF2599 domain-containing protein n=1 Tax=Corynebacterium guangdongense TaxID=1783348 RepID=A0ABU1ZY16_9CORY|nr:DUF2599 domain-containing protein [Corynebacterium guangdongense]MDR7329826.1 hypothetical protein [Corynebacterium guangdongense]WJZ18389.1 hypothetical protein CGUA_09145 [Corynebacterium guangdongense]